MLVKGRIPSIDGFRMISILFVIFSHIVTESHNSFFNTLSQYFVLGDLGVRVFFVISGFLITYLLLNERSNTGTINIKAFYLRRTLRIFPVFYAYLLVIFVLHLLLNLGIPFLVFLGAGLYIHNFAPWGGDWLIAHSWSLAVEEQFYLVWPFIFLGIQNEKKAFSWKFIGLLTFGLGVIMRTFNYKFPDLSEYFLAPFLKHADFLFAGCIMAYLAFYHYELLVEKNKSRPIMVFITVSLILFFSKFEFHPVLDKIFIPTSGTIINVGICFLILYFIVKDKTIGYKFLNSPFVAFIGKLSYSLYVWQQLFISNLNFWWTQFPQNIFLTFLAAYCSYKFIETPFLKIKSRFKILHKVKVLI
jgi:peptidoglycan/LPS O-acetylase OafA/YrhL